MLVLSRVGNFRTVTHLSYPTYRTPPAAGRGVDDRRRVQHRRRLPAHQRRHGDAPEDV